MTGGGRLSVRKILSTSRLSRRALVASDQKRQQQLAALALCQSSRAMGEDALLDWNLSLCDRMAWQSHCLELDRVHAATRLVDVLAVDTTQRG